MGDDMNGNHWSFTVPWSLPASSPNKAVQCSNSLVKYSCSFQTCLAISPMVRYKFYIMIKFHKTTLILVKHDTLYYIPFSVQVQLFKAVLPFWSKKENNKNAGSTWLPAL